MSQTATEVSALRNDPPRLPDRHLPEGWLIGAGVLVALGVAAAVMVSPIAAAALVFAVVGGAWMLFRPQDFWMLTVAALGLSVEVPVGGGTNVVIPTEVLLFPVVGVYAIHLLVLRRLTFVRTPLWLPFIAYTALIALTFVTTDYPGTTYKTAARDLAYAVMGFGVTMLVMTNLKRLKVWLLLALACNTILVLYGMATQFQGGLAIYKPIAEPFYRDHGIYAAFVCFFYAFLIAFWFERWPRVNMNLYRGLLVLVSASLLLSFVRGAWMACFALICYFAWVYRERFGLKTVLIVSFAIVFAIVLVFSLGIVDMLTDRIFSASDVDTTANLDRLDRWLTAWLIIQDHPLTGVGWGAYPDAYPDYSRFPHAFQAGHHMGSHNLYLEILSDGGILALLAFLWLMWVFFYEGHRLYVSTRTPLLRATILGSMGAMLTILVHGFVNNLGPSDKIGLGFYTLLGLMACLRRFVEREETEAAAGPTTTEAAPSGEVVRHG